jgi:hypothetical protein
VVEETQEDVQAVEPVAEPTADVDSSTTEQTAEEVTTEVATTEDTEAVETETAETEATDEAPAESETEETLAPKSQNRFQKLANENRDLKAKLASLEEMQIPTEQDYLDGGYDPIEAKVNAMQAQLSQRDAIEKVTSLNMAIDNDMGRIIHEYPTLDPKSPEFNKELAQTLFEQYDKDSGARYAQDGTVLETNQLPYEYINNKMKLVGLASKKAQVKAQQSVEKMVAQAETPTGSPPKEAKEMTIAEMEAQYGIVRN